MSDKNFSLLNIEEAKKELSLDEEMLHGLMQDFYDSMEEFLAPIRNGLVNQNLSKVRENAHKLKGSALNLRIEALSNSALSLEEAADKGDYEACLDLQEQLDELFTRLGEELEQLSSTGSSSSPDGGKGKHRQ